MKKRLSFCLLITLAILLGQSNAFAQKYPVSITNFNVTPSVFLSDYTSPGSGNIKTTLKFTDYNEASVNVYLRLTIEGPNAKLETSPSFRPAEAYTLVPGEPYVLQDADFTPYFLFQNLQCQGISQADLQRTDQLPDGWYTFTIQVLELNSGKALSQPMSVRANLTLIDPPALVMPAKGQFVKSNAAQISFSWQQPTHAAIAKLNIEYYLRLYEIPDGEDPFAAIQNKSAREISVSNPINGHAYNYGSTDFPLNPGKRYAYTVAAQDITGRKWFKNNGVSEVGWFYFGYPVGGRIPLTYPKNEEALNRKMLQKLEWGANDNLVDNSQPVIYRVKLAKLEPGANPVAVIEETDDWVFESGEILNKSGFSTVLRNAESEAHYAWQVKAFTEEVEVGKSDVQTFYAPPAIEEFIIPYGHVVEVTKITNSKLTDLSGEGRVKVTSMGKKINVHFEHLRIENIDGLMLMTAGEIKCAINGQMEPIPLNPSTAVNDKAICYPDSIRLNQSGMYIKGRVEWDYPFGTLSKEKSKVKFQPTWFSYNDNYRLSGTPKIVTGQTYQLLEPAKFYMVLDSVSYAQVLRNEWEMIFTGQLFVNENVKGTEREYYSIDFSEWRQLHYNRLMDYENANEVRLIANTKMNLIPRTVVVDLSEEQSPPKLTASPDWKGIYFEQFDVRYIPDVDDRGQIKLTREIFNNYTLTVADTCRSWILGDGLHFKYATQIAEEGVVQFNTFPSKIDLLHIDIQKSAVMQARLKGSIRVPVVSQTDRYAYTVPITSTGFQTGYLDKSLEGLSFVFNEKSVDQKLKARIKRAIFAGQNRLDMDLELSWEKINVTFTDLQQFCAWGNYDIGFIQPKGVANLTYQTQGSVEDYKINVEQMGCGRMCNQYAFAVSASVVIDADVAGPTGAPKLNFYSIADNSLLHFDCSMEKQQIETEQKVQNVGNFPMTDEGMGEPTEDRTAEQVAALEAERRAEADAVISAYNSAHTAIEGLQQDTVAVGNLSVTTEDFLASQSSTKEPVQSGELSIKEMIEVLIAAKNFLADLDEQAAIARNSEPKFKEVNAQLDTWLLVLQDVDNQIYAFNKLVEDFKSGAVLEWIIDAAADMLIAKLSEPVVKAGESAKAFIFTHVGTVQNAALLEVDKLQDAFFKAVRDAVAGMSNKSPIVDDIIASAASGLKKEIRYAVEKSVRENFTGYFTSFIDTVIQVRLIGFVDNEIRSNLKKLVTGKAKSISTDEMAKNAGNMLSTIGNDVKELIDINNLSAMMVNTGKDMLNNFHWDKLVSDIVANVASKGAQQIIAAAGGELGDKLLGGAAGDVLSGVMNNVEIDFNALKEGNLKDVIKFDPTHIVIVSKVFEGEGYAKKLKDDPVYGNVFMAHINATIKVPKPFNAFATFISGKELKENFDYWFVEFGCRKLGLPMAPVPLVFDGGLGRVYKHMSRPSPTAEYIPDRNNEFGAGVKAYFYDNTGGSIAAFDVEFTMDIEKEGFRLRMLGDVGIGNKMSGDGEVQRSIAIGYGDMGYSSIEHIFYAKAGVELKMSPLLCAGGEFNCYISPDFWEVSVGTRKNPVYAKLLCKDFISMESWLVVNKNMLDVGLHQLVDINARTPRINLGFIKLDAYAKFRYEFGAELRVFWKPLKVKDAAIYLDIAIAVGIGYDLPWPLGGGDIDLFGVSFGGYLMYRSRTAEEMRALHGTPEQIADYTGEYSVLAGGLHGSVTVIGCKIGLKLDAKKEWK